MNNRQRYALTHPVDEFHLDRLETCKRARRHDDGIWSTVILAIDR